MAVRSGRTIKAIAAAGLAAGAVALAVPASGTGAVVFLQDDRIGAWVLDANRTQAQLGTIITQIKQTRVKGDRVNVFWGEIAPVRPANPRNHWDPAYTWAPYDAVFTTLRANRIRPLAAVFDYPEWTNGRQAPLLRSIGERSPYNPYAPRSRKAFEDFMFAFARRYNGRQPNPNGPGTLGAVRLIETGNEPNLKAFFRTEAERSDIRRFAGLHRAAWRGVRAGNRRAKVILAGFGPNSSGRNGNISARRWLNGLTRQRNVNYHIAGAHIYPTQSPLARNRRRVFPRWDSIPEIQRIVRRARGPARNRRAPIMITEAGWTTAPTPFRDSVVTLAQQRGYIAQLFRRLRTVRTTRGRNPVAAVVMFNYKDNRNWPGGLVQADGRPKPAYDVFRTLARSPIPRRYRRILI